MSKLTRSVLHHPLLERHISALLRGRLVRETVPFFAREARGVRSVHVYRVRESGLRVQIEHGTPDVLTLDQAFYQHAYEPPSTVLSVLEGLGRPLRAVDLGANIGMWGLWLHGRLPVGHVTALEPDPENAAKHRRQIALNGLEGSWELVQAAASSVDGPLSFTVGRATTGRIGQDGEQGTATVPGRDAYALIEEVDLLKLDIEGGEWPILSDARLVGLRVPVVMLEYHPHGAPSANPQEDARRALAGVGYDTHAMLGAPDGTGVVWGWRSPEAQGAGAGQAAALERQGSSV
jgi:FkbM family methyltransferase